MLHATFQVVLYGLLAGFTALGFAATMTVMPSGRLKALGFGAGFVGAQSLTCSVLVIFGIAVTGDTSHPDLRAVLEVALALVLIALALVLHRRPADTDDGPTAHERSKARTQALLERLSRLRVLTTVVAGFLLGIGGPKRLVLTSLAATTIVGAGLRDANQAGLIVVYVTLATALVWGPLVLFLLLGNRVVAFMEDAQDDIGRRQPLEQEISPAKLLLGADNRPVDFGGLPLALCLPLLVGGACDERYRSVCERGDDPHGVVSWWSGRVGVRRGARCAVTARRSSADRLRSPSRASRSRSSRCVSFDHGADDDSP